MFPEGFKQRILDQKYITGKNLLLALEEPSPESIRLNTMKWNKKPAGAQPVPWCKTGYYLPERPSYTLDPLFHSGCYYSQEASGMFLEEVLRQTALPLNNLRVLDLCGAPGGKSTHLSEILGPDNLLVANEVIRSRAVILSENITKWGSGNTLVTQNDPAVFGRLTGYFDIILVDAPCSGEGMFRNRVAVREWSVENANHCSVRQKRIIKDIWPSLKENGILVYSTCTFNPGENEENIKWLTDRHEAQILRLNIEEFDGVKEIDYQGVYGYGFYPDKIKGEGFFISVIRKISKQEKLTWNSNMSPHLKPAREELVIADKWSLFSGNRIIKRGSEVIALHSNIEDYINLFHNLNIVKAGTKICTVKRSNYLPTHELALSQQIRKNIFPTYEVNLSEAILYLRRDNFILTEQPKGWIILTYMDVNLGFVNNIGNRVNNYFPTEWRIRLAHLPLADHKALVWQ